VSVPELADNGSGNPELTGHNRRVVAWKDAQDFRRFRTDKAAGLRNAMLLVGFSADKQTGICTRTVRWLAADSKTRGHGVRKVSAAALWKHIRTLADLGLLVAGHAKEGFADKVRGMDAVNSYTCMFSQVAWRSETEEKQKRNRRLTVSTVPKEPTIPTNQDYAPEDEASPFPDYSSAAQMKSSKEAQRFPTGPAGKVTRSGVDAAWLAELDAFQYPEPELAPVPVAAPEPAPEPAVRYSTPEEFSAMVAAAEKPWEPPELTAEQIAGLTEGIDFDFG
jgi:hypothetical protein